MSEQSSKKLQISKEIIRNFQKVKNTYFKNGNKCKFCVTSISKNLRSKLSKKIELKKS